MKSSDVCDGVVHFSKLLIYSKLSLVLFAIKSFLCTEETKAKPSNGSLNEVDNLFNYL